MYIDLQMIDRLMMGRRASNINILTRALIERLCTKTI